jgi:hypothetical protein
MQQCYVRYISLSMCPRLHRPLLPCPSTQGSPFAHSIMMISLVVSSRVALDAAYDITKLFAVCISICIFCCLTSVYPLPTSIQCSGSGYKHGKASLYGHEIRVDELRPILDSNSLSHASLRIYLLYLYTHIHTYIRIHTYYIHTYAHTYLYTHIHTLKYIYTYTHTHTHLSSVYTYILTHTHTHTSILRIYTILSHPPFYRSSQFGFTITRVVPQSDADPIRPSANLKTPRARKHDVTSPGRCTHARTPACSPHPSGRGMSPWIPRPRRCDSDSDLILTVACIPPS